ncbi:MAG: putative transcriptional regulator [Microbacterium sp.]|jgi:DNA-binding XRE family transcriptional regulator|nr:putative transcriptional regulator [Microbacterium sp.]
MSDEFDPDDRLDEVLRSLADRVKGLRRDRGLSVSDLAFEAGLSEGRLRAVESGRTAASLSTLVALAETFEIGLPDLFSDPSRTNVSEQDAESSSPHVVPSAVVWGGELPPAPWVGAPSSTVSVPADTMPTPGPGEQAFIATEKVWGGPLPPAPWIAEAPLAPAPVREPVPVPAPEAPPAEIVPHRASPVAARAHDYARAHGMRETLAYVFVAPRSPERATPRTFSDLRTGALAGREFRSLQEFAVASIVEGGHALADVARVFRIPAWRLEQWVIETGHTPH